ncbi:MAG: laccase domain-containing protein, partial [Lachnospiraceae bacterium]|nr:laccase domain-containing protein [Lachnospiraceae bacterium]
TLVTFYADCVPLYFVDRKRRAVGLSHSGWRGTVNRMGQATLDAMKEAYGTCPQDVAACIGPSICKACFEVGGEVVEAFREAFPKVPSGMLWEENGKPGKYQLDLWEANKQVLMEAGVPEAQITVTNICTRCNHQYLFSHRKHGEDRGNLAAFLGLR